MELTKIEVQNWKCYSKLTTVQFEHHQILSGANGTGKTSLFEAILFAMTGKAPVGFNLNTVRNDDSQPASVHLWFKNGVDQCEIERVFGGRAASCSLTVNGKVTIENARALDQWVAEVVNLNLLRQLWTSSLVTNDILSVKFFTGTILEEALAEPMKLLTHYKGELYHINREIGRYDAQEVQHVNLSAVRRKITLIEKKLQGHGDLNDAKVAKAKVAQQAAELLKELDGSDKAVEGKDVDGFVRWFPKLEELKQQLEAEQVKKTSLYGVLDKKELALVARLSMKAGKCILCGGDFDNKHVKALEDAVNAPARDDRLIKTLQERIELASAFGSMVPVERYRQWLDAKRQIDQCPEWEEVLKEAKAGTDALWKEHKELKRQEAEGLQQKAEAERISGLRKGAQELKAKVDALKQWIDDASEGYTKQLVAKAGYQLHRLNSRYQQVAICENEFQVVVEDGDQTLHILPVARMSSGEQTLVSLSLLFAVHGLFTPEMPLLFDETFVALDRENLSEVQRSLRLHPGQLFVITHDQTWVDL